MFLFIELLTLTFFLLCIAHANACHGREGRLLMVALLGLGFVRETFVALYEILYSFAPLNFMLGPAPLIGSIIWGYSIYLAIVWAGRVTSENVADGRFGARFVLACAVFMMALACFYEPFLKLIGMARWQPGTLAWQDVPLIALVGYPTLAMLFLLAWRWSARRGTYPRRASALAATLLPIAFGHAFGLQGLKSLLGW